MGKYEGVLHSNQANAVDFSFVSLYDYRIENPNWYHVKFVHVKDRDKVR